MAGVNVGTGYIDIRPDMSGFGRDVKQQVGRNLAQAGDEGARSIKTSLAGAAKGAAAAFATTFAAVKIKDFLGGAIQSASDLAESTSKSTSRRSTSNCRSSEPSPTTPKFPNSPASACCNCASPADRRRQTEMLL